MAITTERLSRRARSALLLAILLSFVACQETQTPVRPVESPTPTPISSAVPVATPTETTFACSGATLTAEPPVIQGGLPEPVASMRDQIIAAAIACDYAELERLLFAGRPFATFSFGASEDAADYWRSLEEAPRRFREPVLELLGRTLNLPFVTETGAVGQRDKERLIYVWPSAHREDPTDADWDLVVPLYGSEVIDDMRALGSGFLGYRTGIVEDGDWIFFVAGD